MIVLSLFIIGHMELFFYTEKGSIISVAGVPTTDIIEPKKVGKHILFPTFSIEFCNSNCLSYVITCSEQK